MVAPWDLGASVLNGGGLGPGSGELEILGVGFGIGDNELCMDQLRMWIEIQNWNADGGRGVGLGVRHSLYARKPRFRIRGERKMENEVEYGKALHNLELELECATHLEIE